MNARAMRLGIVIAVLWVGLAPTAWAADPAQVSLGGQGWRVVEQPAGRAVLLNALAVNEGTSPLAYHARFAVETREVPRRPAAEAPWTLLQNVALPAGELAPGTSVSLDTAVDYGLLPSGKSYRFRVEVLDASEDRVLAQAVLSPAVTPVVAAASSGQAVEGGSLLPPRASASSTGTARTRATAAGRTGGQGTTPSETGGTVSAMCTASGSGTIRGTHTAVRSGSMWVEDGSGAMTVSTDLGTMQLNYTYHSTGTSSATLQATATATGTLRKGSKNLPVTISSASVHMTNAGSRTQTTNALHQTIVTRTGCTATGTFVGTADGNTWRGVLTLTKGVQTLNLTTNVGTHSFDIRFTASQ